MRNSLRCVALIVWLMMPLAATFIASPQALHPRLDSTGPYLILATNNAGLSYGQAIAAAKVLHPAAVQERFDPTDLVAAKKSLLEKHPRYVLLFILPEELDVNFAWR